MITYIWSPSNLNASGCEDHSIIAANYAAKYANCYFNYHSRELLQLKGRFSQEERGVYELNVFLWTSKIVASRPRRVARVILAIDSCYLAEISVEIADSFYQFLRK